MSENAIAFPGFRIGPFSGPPALNPLPTERNPLRPFSKSSLRIAGFWRASERLRAGFKISLVTSGAEVASTLAGVAVGKSTLATAERSVVADGLASSFTSTESAFFTTGVSDTFLLSDSERSSKLMIAEWIDDSAADTSASVASAFPSKIWPVWILACKLFTLASVYNLLSNFLARERIVNNFDLSTESWWFVSSFLSFASSASSDTLASSGLAGVTSTGLATAGAA